MPLSRTSVHFYGPGTVVPIVEEEAAAIGLGKINWPRNVKFTLSP